MEITLSVCWENTGAFPPRKYATFWKKQDLIHDFVVSNTACKLDPVVTFVITGSLSSTSAI